jgi:hypothetical protein
MNGQREKVKGSSPSLSRSSPAQLPAGEPRYDRLAQDTDYQFRVPDVRRRTTLKHMTCRCAAQAHSCATITAKLLGNKNQEATRGRVPIASSASSSSLSSIVRISNDRLISPDELRSEKFEIYSSQTARNCAGTRSQYTVYEDEKPIRE